jgi:hypothetical protein
MRHFVQYHNYEKLQVLPRRDPPFLEGKGYVNTSVRTVTGACGDTALLILGIGEPRRSFFLWERFEIESVKSQGEYVTERGKSVELFLATGKGWQLIPPARLEGKEFDEFRRACADFVGFRAIDQLSYLKTLIDLSVQNRKSNYDESLEAFCSVLIGLAPDEAEAYYYRGLVRQHLGRHSQAGDDFREAATQLTSLLRYAEENVPAEERDAERMDRIKRYLRESKQKSRECQSCNGY